MLIRCLVVFSLTHVVGSYHVTCGGTHIYSNLGRYCCNRRGGVDTSNLMLKDRKNLEAVFSECSASQTICRVTHHCNLTTKGELLTMALAAQSSRSKFNLGDLDELVKAKSYTFLAALDSDIKGENLAGLFRSKSVLYTVSVNGADVTVDEIKTEKGEWLYTVCQAVKYATYFGCDYETTVRGRMLVCTFEKLEQRKC